MLFGTLVLAAIAVATPVTIEEYALGLTRRDIADDLSVKDYDDLYFYAQHAAAAYCNFNKPAGQTITCRSTACPAVQANKPIIAASLVAPWTGVGAYIAVDHVRKDIVLSVRGSNNIRNFVTDVLFVFQDCPFVNQCKVHAGFAKGWQEIEATMTAAMRAARDSNPGYRLVVTGHSLGGAVATIGAAYLRRSGLPVDVYTYGSPRVGNDHFATWMTAQQGGQWRVTHRDDPVPRLPPIFLGYRHISPEYWLVGGGSGQRDYAIDQIRVCYGIANTDCNGGTFGFNVVSHLHYLGETSACTGFPLVLKRDISNEALVQRLDEWSWRDQQFVKNMTMRATA